MWGYGADCVEKSAKGEENKSINEHKCLNLFD